jgi:DNA-binding MarR family transcriptional regulator
MSAQTRRSRPGLAARRRQAAAYLDLTRIHRDIERRVTELLAQARLQDVTPAQANVLMLLFQAKASMTARALAQHMALSEVTVGRFVKALEAAGWIDRRADPDDGRRQLVRPTEKAYRALPRFISVSNTLLDEAFAGFTPAEVSRIATTTERLRRNIGGD